MRTQAAPVFFGLIAIILSIIFAQTDLAPGSRRGGDFAFWLVFAIFALVAFVAVFVSWLNLLSGKYDISMTESGFEARLYAKYQIQWTDIESASLQPLPANMRMQIGARHRFNLVLTLKPTFGFDQALTFLGRKTCVRQNQYVLRPVGLPKPYYAASPTDILEQVKLHISRSKVRHAPA